MAYKIPSFSSLLLFYHVWTLCSYRTDAVPLYIEDSTLRVNINNSLDANSSSNTIHPPGCRYQSVLYSQEEQVPTKEPCLYCECKNTMVICKLRICPEVPVPPPPGCIVVHKAHHCCARLVCHNDKNRKVSRDHRLPKSNTTLEIISQNQNTTSAYCVQDGTIYSEGSAMMSSSLCEYCFCIRGKMKCSSPQCVIPMSGCQPRFRSFACCPTNYECSRSNETSIVKKVPNSVSRVPEFLKGCQINGKYIKDGEPVMPLSLAAIGKANHNMSQINPCQTCFCMGGTIRCKTLDCDRPIEGCRPVFASGHCCPDRYDCDSTEEAGNVATVRAEVEKGAEDTEDVMIRTGVAVETLDTTVSLLSEESTEGFTMRAQDVPDGNIEPRKALNNETGSREDRQSKDGDEYKLSTSFEKEYKEVISTLNHGTGSVQENAHAKLESIFEKNLLFGDETTIGYVENTINENESKESGTTVMSSSVNEPSGTMMSEPSESLLPVSSFQDDLFNDETVEADKTDATEVEISTIIPPLLPLYEMKSPLDTSEESSDYEPQKSRKNPSDGRDEEDDLMDDMTSSDTKEEYVENLKFIPFKMEDALLPSNNNSASGTQFTSVKLKPTPDSTPIGQRPDLLKRISPPQALVAITVAERGREKTGKDAVPESLNNESHEDPERSSNEAFISSSLYNNGFYRKEFFPRHDEKMSTSLPDDFLHFDRKQSSETGPFSPMVKDLLNSTEKGDSSLALKEKNNPNEDYPLRTYSKFSLQDLSPNHYGVVAATPPAYELLSPMQLKFNVAGNSVRTQGSASSPNEIFAVPANSYDKTEKYFDHGDHIHHHMSKSRVGDDSMFHEMTVPAPPTTNFKPLLPFAFQSKDDPFNLGLKLSGCNIYGKMYNVGHVIQELSSSCVQCNCTELGVQCNETPC